MQKPSDGGVTTPSTANVFARLLTSEMAVRQRFCTSDSKMSAFLSEWKSQLVHIKTGKGICANLEGVENITLK